MEAKGKSFLVKTILFGIDKTITHSNDYAIEMFRSL